MLRAGFTLIAAVLILVVTARMQMVQADTEDIAMETMTEPNARTDADSVAMQVRVAGDGPRLALVGGGLTGRASWEPHEAHLKKERTVATLQPISVQYGLEERGLPANYGVPMESAALGRTLDSLKWHEPLDVVAWSYGALIALDFALTHPERIRTLTLIEPPAFWVLEDMGAGDPDVEAMRALELRNEQVGAADLERFVRSAGLVPPGMDPRSMPQWDVWMEHRRSLRAVTVPLSFDGADPTRLQAFDRPVLLVTGTGTSRFLRRIHDTLAAQLSHAVTVELPGGHAPQVVSMDRFLSELQDFLAAEYAASKDGTPIGFVRRGSGPAMLFVHGTTADRRSWARIAPHLERHLTVYAMDRRGRGLSGDAADYAFAREAEDVAAVVEAIGEPVILFGHSYGGLCALEAARLTGHVKRLILYEPALPNGTPSFAENDLLTVRELVHAGELESAMDTFLRKIAQISAGELEAYQQSPLWNARIPHVRTVPRELQIEKSYVFDPSRFSDLEIPTTLLLGSDSPQMYRDAVETLCDTLPRSRVVSLAGQEHVAHHAAPDLLARVILTSVNDSDVK